MNRDSDQPANAQQVRVGGGGGGDGGPLEDEPATEKPRHESVGRYPESDDPTAEDLLGFAPYVEGLARFLENEETDPPLTVSIEGAWGSGKSSFLLQLKNRLERGGDDTNQASPNPVTVEFNPWRHREDESLWASFALSTLNQLRGQQPLLDRLRGDLDLFFSRWENPAGLMGRIGACLSLASLLVAGLVSVGFLFTTVYFLAGIGPDLFPWTTGILPEVASGLTSATAGGLLGAWGLLKAGRKSYKRFLQPVQSELQRHVQRPEYESKVSFIDRFHEDFSKIVDSYVDDSSRVYVFIDDLDRCEVPRSRVDDGH